MATNNYSLIDIQEENQEIDLQFQDFGTSETNPAQATISSNNQSYFSSFHEQNDDTDKLLGGDDAEEAPAKSVHSFWTFEYYQQFFNVESKQVGDRILWSMIPKPGINYLQTYIRPNADLYGPFWICVTLIFTTAITGNLANYLQTPDNYKWKYDFHKVTLATSSIFCYAWLVPLLIWGLLLWRGSKAHLSLLELICLYGYSLAVFVPVSLLWMIPLKWLQFCLGIVASVLSGGVLVRTILPAISHESKRTAMAVAAIILILHASLALGFMLYFFYPPSTGVSPAKVDFSSNATANLSPEEPKGESGKAKDVVRNVNPLDGNKNDLDQVIKDKKLAVESVSKREDNFGNEDKLKIPKLPHPLPLQTKKEVLNAKTDKVAAASAHSPNTIKDKSGKNGNKIELKPESKTIISKLPLTTNSTKKEEIVRKPNVDHSSVNRTKSVLEVAS